MGLQLTAESNMVVLLFRLHLRMMSARLDKLLITTGPVLAFNVCKVPCTAYDHDKRHQSAIEDKRDPLMNKEISR